METSTSKSKLVGITEITKVYLPISKKRARRFVSLYLDPKIIGKPVLRLGQKAPASKFIT